MKSGYPNKLALDLDLGTVDMSVHVVCPDGLSADIPLQMYDSDSLMTVDGFHRDPDLAGTSFYVVGDEDPETGLPTGPRWTFPGSNPFRAELNVPN